MNVLKKAESVLNKYHIKGLYIFVVVYIIFVTICNPVFLTWNNLMNLLRQISVYGIIACGITFVMLTGRVELSAGMMISLLCEVSCFFVIKGIDNQFLAITVPVAVGALLGLINGFLVGKLKLNSFIATLGTMSVFMGIGLLFYSSVKQLWANQDDKVFRFIGNGSILGIPAPIIIFAAVAVFSSIVLKKTVFGQRVYAVGGNIVNSRFSGVNPTRMIMAVYVISGAFTGLASVVMTARIMGVNTKMGAGYEFTCLTAIVLGGLSIKGGSGNILGSVIGILIIGILTNSFTLLGINPFMQYVIQGFILAAAVSVQMLSGRRKRL